MQQTSLALGDDDFLPAAQNLRKATGAIHIRNDITNQQRRLISVLLFNAQHDIGDLSRPSHSMPLSVLIDMVKFESNNTAYLKDSLSQLVGKKIKWDIINSDGEREWGIAALLADASIKNGMLTYSFAPALRPKLAMPERWALIDMHVVRNLNTKAGLALYENMVVYRPFGVSPYFELNVFRELLGATDKSYDEFKILNRSVIKPALEEVNRETRFNIEPEFKRERRQVVGIRFRFGAPGVAETSESDQDPVEAALDPRAFDQLSHDYGLGEVMARKILAENSLEKLQRIMEYVGSRFTTGKITPSKVAGYFLSTLKGWDDTVPTVSRLEVLQQKVAEADNPSTADLRKLKEAEQQERQRELAILRKRETEQRWSVLQPTEQETMLKEFEAYVQKFHTPALPFLKQDGISHPMIVGCFNEFLQLRLLGEAPAEVA